jgi:flagellar motor component MotA
MNHTLRITLGLVAGTAIAGAGYLLEGGNPSLLFDRNALLMMAGGTAGYLLMGFSLTHQLRSWRAAFGGDAGARDLAVAQRYFTAMGDGVVMFGIVGTVFGVIHVLENLDKPDTIGRGLAVAFLSLLYGYMIRTFVAGALGDAVTERLHQEAQPPSSPQATQELPRAS